LLLFFALKQTTEKENLLVSSFWERAIIFSRSEWLGIDADHLLSSTCEKPGFHPQIKKEARTEMVIDVHYHLIPALPEEMVENLIEDVARAARVMRKKVDRGELLERARERWPDPSGEKLLLEMEKSGIDFTCISAVDRMESKALTPEVAQFQNKIAAQIAEKNPRKLMAFAGVDPRRPQAADMLKQCFEEFGMRGLKYHPDHGYNPVGEESYKLLAIVERHKGILLTHTGPLGPPSRCKFTEPGLLADLAVDFPGLKVIAAHSGQVNWREWAALASHQPNLFGDLAMWDALAFGHFELFCRELRDLIDFAGVEKVLFGTGGPIYGIISPVKKWVQLLKDLPGISPPGVKFAEEEVSAILGGNAKSILGLA